MKKYWLIWCVLAMAGMVSCSHKGEQRVPDADTATIEASASVAAEPTPLPDTVYPSAEMVRYEVVVEDQAHTGVLCTLRDPYEERVGDVLTFRGNQRRSAPYVGSLTRVPDSLVVDWVYTTDFDTRKSNHGTWGGGSGWTGQPVLTGDTVLVTSLASKLYFIDFMTGKALRPSVDVGNPIKGSAMLDPWGKHMLYIGQGVSVIKPWGYLTYDLRRDSIIQQSDEDPHAWRHWGGCDSSPVRAGQFVFRPHENGTIYKWYSRGDTLALHSLVRYRVGGAAPGIESSMAVYRNYGYTADNHGNVICWNLHSLTPVWCYPLHDDIDATPVIEVQDGVPYLYVGCEVDRQGQTGMCHIAKLHGLTGERVWQYDVACQQAKPYDKVFEGGLYSTPLLGVGDCDSLLIVPVVTNYPSMTGECFALNRYTGEVVWSFKMASRPWMSPVAFQTPDGRMYIVAGDTDGRLYLVEGVSGHVISRQRVGANFESSPVVRGNSLVVGSRGDKIYKVSVR